MPMGKVRYPANWKRIAAEKKASTGWKCEVCSECRHRNENIHAGMPGINGGVWSNPYIWSGANYCPNCGAKMKEGD